MNSNNDVVWMINCKSFITFLVIVISLISCVNTEQKKLKVQVTELSFITINDTLHYIQIKTDSSLNKWELPYPVYQFQTGDINNNGTEEMMVGVVKTTRFDTLKGKRLFIFKNYKGLVRPLWLGSRLSQPLVDFCFIQTEDGPRIRSIEQEKSGKYLVVEYKWQKFGLKFTRYILREVEKEEAIEHLETN